MPSLKPWSMFNMDLSDVDDPELIEEIRNRYELVLKEKGDKKYTENYLVNMGKEGGRIARFSNIESRINKLDPESQRIAREGYWKTIEPILGKDVEQKKKIFNQIFPDIGEQGVESSWLDPTELALDLATLSPATAPFAAAAKILPRIAAKKGLGRGIRTGIESLKGKIGSVEELLGTVTARSKLLGVKKPVTPIARPAKATKTTKRPAVKPLKPPSAKPKAAKTKPEIPTLSDEAKKELERLLQ